ncbi:MAG: diadenylate cyclase CdaA [Bacteroidales bacterium]|nr:diadenylate cyclase CdaA [Candidatus Cryptobacteroides equifaecalis]
MLLELLGFLNFSFIDIADILLIAAVMFLVFKWIRGSSAMNIFLAIVILLIVRVFVAALGMKMMSNLLDTVIDVGAIALIVIFQPEVRRFLNNMGRKAGYTIEKRPFLHRLLMQNGAEVASNPSISEIAQACMEMSESRTGALIVIRKSNTLEDIISTGDVVDARISCRLIMNIFFKNSPLHDGAMIIGGDRIIAARCTLPITERTDIPASYGMRHKAALGIAEQSDAEVLVVSEETGRISYVKGGEVKRAESVNDVKLFLSGQA